MAIAFKDLFTPLFILISISIFIAGIVFLQFIEKFLIGSKNLNGIRMFGFALIINIIILVFLIMSFSKVKFAEGPQGPQGNKGDKGYDGDDGGLNVCDKKYQTVEDKKNFERDVNYLDLKPPRINDD